MRQHRRHAGWDGCHAETAGDQLQFRQPVARDAGALSHPGDPYRELGGTFLRSIYQMLASPQSAPEAAAVVVKAATTDAPFRWQTSLAAAASVGLSLADLDDSNAVNAMSAWLD